MKKSKKEPEISTELVETILRKLAMKVTEVAFDHRVAIPLELLEDISRTISGMYRFIDHINAIEKEKEDENG